MIDYAVTAKQEHLGLWTAPFDRLIDFKGLDDAQRQEILRHHESRLNASIANRDIHQIKVAGGALTNYLHDRRDYGRARDRAQLRQGRTRDCRRDESDQRHPSH